MVVLPLSGKQLDTAGWEYDDDDDVNFGCFFSVLESFLHWF